MNGMAVMRAGKCEACLLGCLLACVRACVRASLRLGMYVRDGDGALCESRPGSSNQLINQSINQSINESMFWIQYCKWYCMYTMDAM